MRRLPHTPTAIWTTTRLLSIRDVTRLLLDSVHKGYLWRGQSRSHSLGLVPSIDRDKRASFSRKQKLSMERSSIDRFRLSFSAPATESERVAAKDDIATLMLLRHHAVPTRLLDWSSSSQVALYFASEPNANNDGELWAFDWNAYQAPAELQWRQWKQTTLDNSGDPNKFDAKRTAFRIANPPNWIVAATYKLGFPRHDAQQSAYTMTARFGVDHAIRLAELLPDANTRHRYTLDSRLKSDVRTLLREHHGVWDGSLFPDAAGAAKVAAGAFLTSPKLSRP